MRRRTFRGLNDPWVYKGAIWGRQIGNPGLKAGDRSVCTIERIGTLRNPVQAAPAQ